MQCEYAQEHSRQLAKCVPILDAESGLTGDWPSHILEVHGVRSSGKVAIKNEHWSEQGDVEGEG
jgi:hypothetical protein